MTPKPIKVLFPRNTISYTEVVCSKCENPVEMVFGESADNGKRVACLQPIDGLHLVNHYGYGMWRDHLDETTSARHIVLCAPCTDKFFVDNHWLERYLNQ